MYNGTHIALMRNEPTVSSAENLVSDQFLATNNMMNTIVKKRYEKAQNFGFDRFDLPQKLQFFFLRRIMPTLV